jgi:NitT/TauT family transport system permease protein/sulfonate transport system permease protein
MVTLMKSGELGIVLASSAQRMVLGFVIGSSLGVIIGVAMGRLPRLRWTLAPLLELFRPIPAAAIIPPLIFILGTGETLRITIIALSAFFPVMTNTLSGVDAIDSIYFQVLRTFRVPGARAIRKVILPAITPYIMSGLRTSLAIALVTTTLSEMIVGQSGIGFYIVSMQYAMRPADMFAAVIVLSLFGYLINRLFVLWEARVLHWAHS